jgi:hypothetical protein
VRTSCPPALCPTLGVCQILENEQLLLGLQTYFPGPAMIANAVMWSEVSFALKCDRYRRSRTSCGIFMNKRISLILWAQREINENGALRWTALSHLLDVAILYYYRRVSKTHWTFLPNWTRHYLAFIAR